MSFSAIILVAGSGSRLRPLTDDRPKCLVDLGQAETILSRMVRQLVAHGARAIVASTGYRAEAVREALSHCKVPVLFAHNPDYESTQNVVSLYRALTVAPAGEVLKLDGDLVFEDKVLARVLADTSDAQLAMDPNGPLGEEEMKVMVSEGFAVRFGKDIDPRTAAGESIGLERFSPAKREDLHRSIAFAVEHGRKNIYYEEVYNDLVSEGLRFRALGVGDLRWTEVDTNEDLGLARAALAGSFG